MKSSSGATGRWNSLQRPLLLDAAFLSKELHEARGNFCRLFVWTLDRWEGAGEMGAKISPYHQRYHE